jgi:hypothetical protein
MARSFAFPASLGPRLGTGVVLATAVLGILAGGSLSWAGQASVSGTGTLGESLQSSTAEQKALSEHLRRKGAVFYGAWWCPACFKQKYLFGKEAVGRLPYVECDKSDSGRERCKAAGIRAFPTWVMGSSRVEGVQTIEELKRWSGFPGS